MNAVQSAQDTAQTNATCLLEHWGLLNIFLSVEKDVISAEVKLPQGAIEEIQKFLCFFKDDNWPENILKVKNTLLCATIFDEKNMINRCSDNVRWITWLKRHWDHIQYLFCPLTVSNGLVYWNSEPHTKHRSATYWKTWRSVRAQAVVSEWHSRNESRKTAHESVLVYGSPSQWNTKRELVIMFIWIWLIQADNTGSLKSGKLSTNLMSTT